MHFHAGRPYIHDVIVPLCAADTGSPPLPLRDAVLSHAHGHGYTRKQVCVEVEGECFVAAAAGEHHTLVVNQYGDVSTFGRGREGQLGHGEASRLDTADVPRKVKKVVDIIIVVVVAVVVVADVFDGVLFPLLLLLKLVLMLVKVCSFCAYTSKDLNFHCAQHRSRTARTPFHTAVTFTLIVERGVPLCVCKGRLSPFFCLSISLCLLVCWVLL